MKTRKPILMIVVIVFSMLGAACSSAAAGVSTADETAQAGNFGADATLSLPAKLAVGILKLEDSDQAVTTEQATELLTLWQAYQALENSDTTAAAELDAVVNQIQGTLTDEQVKAIEAMNLTRQSMMEVMQSLGTQFGPSGTPGVRSTPGAGGNSSGDGGFRGFQGGGFPGGGPGEGGGFQGGGPFGGGEVPFEGGAFPQGTPNATAQARSSEQASRVNPMLLQALISMLEGKAGASE
jgi:hypothetical protein